MESCIQDLQQARRSSLLRRGNEERRYSLPPSRRPEDVESSGFQTKTKTITKSLKFLDFLMLWWRAYLRWRLVLRRLVLVAAGVHCDEMLSDRRGRLFFLVLLVGIQLGFLVKLFIFLLFTLKFTDCVLFLPKPKKDFNASILL